MIVGVDEAGRGPLAGSVVGCALYLKKIPPFPVKDSKALSIYKREEFFSYLISNAIISLGIATSEEIDKFNIRQATFLAFNRAIENILRKASYLKKAIFIIDGNAFDTHLNIKYRCKVGADKKVREVACASVVAKVIRDHLMRVADFLYPDWNFSQHKGYPTCQHFSLIEKYSLSPLHRYTFCRYRRNSNKLF